MAANACDIPTAAVGASQPESEMHEVKAVRRSFESFDGVGDLVQPQPRAISAGQPGTHSFLSVFFTETSSV
jgi:hypothetical protein